METFNVNAVDCWIMPTSQYRNTIAQHGKQGYSVRVLKVSLDGVPLAEYDSVKDAAEANGGSSSGISSVLTGRKQTAYGFYWRYA